MSNEKTMTFTIAHRDIEQFAKERLKMTLTPHQLFIIDALAQDKTTFLMRRQADYKKAKSVLYMYVAFEGDYVKHFENVHYRGITINGKKFSYCPVGVICSWSEGDFKNKWCHFCKKYYSELKEQGASK